MLIDKLAEWALSRSPTQCVRDLRVGLGYTAVLLDDGRCGVAYTFREDAREGCCVIGEAGRIAGRPAAELVSWAASSDPITAAAALATVNALADAPVGATDSDLLPMLPLASNDVVGMIGFFGPLIEPLRQRAEKLYIFERHPEHHPGTLPQARAGVILSQCQIVILSATALLNRTIDHLLPHCGAAREVALLGPSTPLIPEVLQSEGVTILSGIQVTDATRLLQIVSEGGGTRQLHGAVRKLTMRIAPGRSTTSPHLPDRDPSRE